MPQITDTQLPLYTGTMVELDLLTFPHWSLKSQGDGMEFSGMYHIVAHIHAHGPSLLAFRTLLDTHLFSPTFDGWF